MIAEARERLRKECRKHINARLKIGAGSKEPPHVEFSFFNRVEAALRSLARVERERDELRAELDQERPRYQQARLDAKNAQTAALDLTQRVFPLQKALSLAWSKLATAANELKRLGDTTCSREMAEARDAVRAALGLEPHR